MNSTQLDNLKENSARVLIEYSNGHVDARLQGSTETQDIFYNSIRLHYLYGIIKEARLEGSSVFVGSKAISDADIFEAYHKIWHFSGQFDNIDLSAYSDIESDDGDGDSETGSGGGTVTSDNYRAGNVSVAAGAAVVTFSSPLSSTDYEVTAYVRTAGGYEQRNLGVTTKTLNGFTVSNIIEGGTLFYIAILDA